VENSPTVARSKAGVVLSLFNLFNPFIRFLPRGPAGLDRLISRILKDQLPNLIVQLLPVADKISGPIVPHRPDAFFVQDLENNLRLSATPLRLPGGNGPECIRDAIELLSDVRSDSLRPLDLTCCTDQRFVS
jgi:hypothetical protein